MSTHSKKVFLSLTLFINSCFSFSQQEPNSTLFWNNYLHTNPAMTGAVYKHQANVSWKDYRAKKALYEGISYQQTIFANYATKIDKINSGIGTSYCFDSYIGYQIQTALVSYAYHIPIKSMFLSIGASGGIKTLKYTLPVYYTDTAAISVLTKDYAPTFTTDFGIALRHEKWNLGLSMTQWNGPSLRAKDGSFIGYKLVANFWLFGDYRFTLGENWSLTSRAQFKLDKYDIQANVQVIAAWKENLWFGAGIQSSFNGGVSVYSINPMIGYDIKGKFRLGYTARISTNNNYFAQLYKPLTHEVVLGFMLK